MLYSYTTQEIPQSRNTVLARHRKKKRRGRDNDNSQRQSCNHRYTKMNDLQQKTAFERSVETTTVNGEGSTLFY